MSATPDATAPVAQVATTVESVDIDPSLLKSHKVIGSLKAKNEKQAEQIAELKKANAELKSAGSRIKKIPKSDKEKPAKKGKAVTLDPSDPALAGGVPAVAPA